MIPQFNEAIVSYIFLAGIFVSSIAGFFLRGFYYANVYQPSQVFAGKRLWTTITSVFVHGSWLHLLINVVFCLLFMTEVEYMLVDDFGPLVAGGILCLLLVGIVSAANLITGYRFRREPDVSAVGLSGFSFAMAVFFYVYFPLDSPPELPMLRAYHYALAVPFGCLIAGMAKLPGNHRMHLVGCGLGMLAALLVRPAIITELWTHFRP